jgi:nitroreductase
MRQLSDKIPPDDEPTIRQARQFVAEFEGKGRKYPNVIGELSMDFFEVLKARHSIRAYDARPIEPEKLQQILEAIDGAPSAGNLQAFEVYLVCAESTKAALAKAAGDQDFLIQAPVCLIFCSHPALSSVKYEARGSDLYCLQDATIACAFAMLTASALLLSTVWVGAFDDEEVRCVINAPAEHRPVAILPIGYAAATPRIRARRSLSDLIHQVN